VSAQERTYYNPNNQPVSKSVAGHKRKTGESRTVQLVIMASARLALSPSNLFTPDNTQQVANEVQIAKKAAEKACLDKKLTSFR
jgi:hypothetical protein